MAIGFGIIGCGMISRFHAKAVADIKGAKVTACFDSFTSAADKFGAEIGCKVYHDLDKMLADKTVDVVTICTPSGVHVEPAVAAAKAGKHVIVEKPLESRSSGATPSSLPPRRRASCFRPFFRRDFTNRRSS